MKRGSTYFLRAVLIVMSSVIVTVCVLALPVLWSGAVKEYDDMAYMVQAILVVMYLAVVPFFYAAIQAWRLLGFVDKKRPFSFATVRALKRIMYSAFVISMLFAASLPFFYIWAQNDDAPGLIIIGMFFSGAPFVIGVFAAVLQQLFKEAAKLKSESDLTV